MLMNREKKLISKGNKIISGQKAYCMYNYGGFFSKGAILLHVLTGALLLDRRSIDLSGAREKEGHFHFKNFMRASR